MSMVFMSSYEGILVAMLTIPRVMIPIDSLTDLVHQDDLPWRLEYGATVARMKAGQHQTAITTSLSLSLCMKGRILKHYVFYSDNF